MAEARDTENNKDNDCIGAIAVIASMYIANLNPYVITFGAPLVAIFEPCPQISTATMSLWCHSVNTKAAKTLQFGITYDPIPFAIPGMG